MEIPNGKLYFLGALYHTTGSFGQLGAFVSKLSDRLEVLPYDRTSVLEATSAFIREFQEDNGKITAKTALHKVMIDDLQKVERILADEQYKQKIDNEFHLEHALIECRDQGVSLLKDIGLPIDPPEIYVVDAMPAPYDKAELSAIATDDDDYKQHGILPGIYFLRARLRPFYSRFLLLHELIHTVLGARSPFLFGRGLEEGLAEIVGAFFLSSKILGTRITTDLFMYNRLGSVPNQFWEIYLDYTRQAAYLYQRFGMTGLIALLSEGREKIKEIESYCLKNELDSVCLPDGRWDNEVSALINYLLLTFGRNLVVSPLAKYLLPFVLPARTTSEILTVANVELKDGAEAIKELQARIVATVVRKDGFVVSLSDAVLLSPGSIVRYEIPE